MLKLESLCVLLSPIPAEESAVTEAAGGVDGRATRPEVNEATVNWAQRCDQNPDDAAILYVAGHGCSMVLGGGYLLLEGFGQVGSTLDHALNLSALIEAMATNRIRSPFGVHSSMSVPVSSC